MAGRERKAALCNSCKDLGAQGIRVMVTFHEHLLADILGGRGPAMEHFCPAPSHMPCHFHLGPQ